MALNFLNDGYFAGKVGIGTPSPSTSLHIDQSSNDRAGGLYIETNASNYGLSMFVNSGGYGVIGSNGTFTTDILTLDLNSGNVGIGASGPGVKLDVAGEIRTSSNFIADNATLGSLSLRISGTETGRLDNFNSALRLINFHATSETAISGNGNISLTSIGSSNIELSTANTERMRITSAGGISFGSTGTAYGTSGQILKSNGNASPTWIDGSAIPGVPGGSGTLNTIPLWTPDGDTLGNSVLKQNGNNIEQGVVGTTASAYYFFNTTTTGDSGLIFRDNASTNSGFLTYNHDSNAMKFATAGSEKMRILSNGNVGIGVTNPSQKLVVQGSNHFVTFTNPSTTVNHYAQILLQAGDASNYIWTANQNSTAWAGARSLNIYTSTLGANIGFFTEGDATNTKLMILGNGNVGIGTNSPGEALEVVGNIKITAAVLSNQQNTDVDTGTETVAEVSTAAFTAAFFDFVIKKTTNVRSGTVYACHDGTTVQFTETSTQDLGNTSDVTLSVDISGGNMRLRATTTSDNWIIKSLIRAI